MSDESSPAPSRDLATAEAVTGRLGMITGISMLVGAIPIPLLPDQALRYLRGAIAHEVASRHGLSLSTDARDVLSTPGSKDRMREVMRRGVEAVTKRLLRRIGPLGALSAMARTVEVYALGHLLDRYFDRVRPGGAARLLEAEARRVRQAIDTAVLRSVYPSTEAKSLLLPQPAEDMRDEFTRTIDRLLLGAATLPSYLERRLEAAFDAVVEETPELRQGGH